jgi:hypothetical protein
VKFHDDFVVGKLDICESLPAHSCSSALGCSTPEFSSAIDYHDNIDIKYTSTIHSIIIKYFSTTSDEWNCSGPKDITKSSTFN